MRKNILSSLFICLSVATTLLCSCKEEIDQRNRYTFVGETIADYLQNREEQYSHFTYILKRAKLGTTSASNILSLMSSYGDYTCFAPDNNAIERFLVEQDSIYWENVRALEANEISKKDFVDTGIHSPILEELSDSMVSEIAKNHIINTGIMTFDLTEGAFPNPNFNNRFMSVRWTTDENERVYTVVNNSSRIIIPDVGVENGVVQVIDNVLNPSTALLPDLLSSQDKFSIYSQALKMTGMEDSLRKHIDNSYTLGGKTDNSLFGSNIVPYPDHRYFKNTLLVVPDSLLINKFDIKDINDLIELANKWYGKDYYDVVDDNFTSRDNPLNRFISYHIIDRQLQYASNSGTGGFIMENYICNYSGFDSEINMPKQFDRYDYFETMMPFTSIKVTRPFTNNDLRTELVLNYAQDKGKKCYNADMRSHMNVIVMPLSRVTEELGITDFDQNALNGIIHVIDRPIIFNKQEMAGNILNERMRWDYLSFWPELTNNNVRWRQKSAIEQVMIPDGFCERLRFNTVDGKIAMYCPTGNGPGVYQGDELQVMNDYDIEHRLPYVPEGTYELRYGYQVWSNRGIAQFYVDGKVTGLPIDMTMSTSHPRIGWLADEDDEEIDNMNDKAMRNRGFMKAPASIQRFAGQSIRDWDMTVRVILSTTHLADGVDHWVRIKNVKPDWANTALQLDYFEIVPKGIVTDPVKLEDKY